MSLRNGGGKTVLVQMMTAPFVHKRYRDTKDRKFESYFTTNRPTFIMVEWVLDGEAGYVLTGMMVRKNPRLIVRYVLTFTHHLTITGSPKHISFAALIVHIYLNL